MQRRARTRGARNLAESPAVAGETATTRLRHRRAAYPGPHRPGAIGWPHSRHGAAAPHPERAPDPRGESPPPTRRPAAPRTAVTSKGASMRRQAHITAHEQVAVSGRERARSVGYVKARSGVRPRHGGRCRGRRGGVVGRLAGPSATVGPRRGCRGGGLGRGCGPGRHRRRSGGLPSRTARGRARNPDLRRAALGRGRRPRDGADRGHGRAGRHEREVGGFLEQRLAVRRRGASP